MGVTPTSTYLWNTSKKMKQSQLHQVERCFLVKTHKKKGGTVISATQVVTTKEIEQETQEWRCEEMTKGLLSLQLMSGEYDNACPGSSMKKHV